ncbi:MAG TPA: hypothetical protein VHK88_05250, partial [Aquihabitans sp.]|nr:hypothetical protein [Aquihabitans sp.]
MSTTLQETTTSFEVDDAGLAAVRTPRDDLVLEAADGDGRYELAEGPFERYERTLAVEPLGDGRHRVRETTRWELAIPLWGRLFRPVVRKALARHGAPDGDGAAAPWWSPPTRFDARSAQVLSRLCGMA